jgi:protein-serine/threonine kinase
MGESKFSLKRLFEKKDASAPSVVTPSKPLQLSKSNNPLNHLSLEADENLRASSATPNLPHTIPSHHDENPSLASLASPEATAGVDEHNKSIDVNSTAINDSNSNNFPHVFTPLVNTNNSSTTPVHTNSLTPVRSPSSMSSEGTKSHLSPEKLVEKKPKSRNISQTSSISSKQKSTSQSGTTSNGITHVNSHTSISSIPVKEKPRFRMLELGSHEHCLRAAKRQEKLSNMLKDLLGAKKLRSEAKSAIPADLQNLVGNGSSTSQVNKNKPPTLFSGLVNHMKINGEETPAMNPEEMNSATQTSDARSFVEKYGKCQEVIGKGSFGVVRVSHKKVFGDNSFEEKLYAVKEFKRRQQESDKKYNRRLTSEFCISSSLKHLNIIDTLDLLKDAKGDYCEVMEYCAGGDLYTLIITSGKLEYAEADCFFKQLITGVNYMHDMGVSHRDLKPENILITQSGVIKITDFGNSECFRMAWENEVQYSEGVCGSSPYIAPEEFTQTSFDPRKVDIWACGVIYMAMRTGRQLWKLADETKDEFFQEYLVKRKKKGGYEPIESLKRARCRNVIYSILDPKPERRITGQQILSSEWGREIKVCDAGEGKSQSQLTSPPAEGSE